MVLRTPVLKRGYGPTGRALREGKRARPQPLPAGTALHLSYPLPGTDSASGTVLARGTVLPVSGLWHTTILANVAVS
eukprot:1157023-Rhodomonas_salina.4